MRKIFLFFALFGLVISLDSGKWYSVVKVDGAYEIIQGKQVPESLAWGLYADDTYEDGWGKLTIFSEGFQDPSIAYAIGLLEGAFQIKYIYYQKINFYEVFFQSQTASDKISKLIQDQHDFTIKQVKLYYDTSKYWRTVALWQHVLEGMLEGYNRYSPQEQKLTQLDFSILQTMGDMSDIKNAIKDKIDWFNLSDEEFENSFLLNNHCTAMIKIKDDLSDVFLGHNTWNTGEFMLRNYKFYNFGQDLKMQYSSYPGLIFSWDDYYILQRQDQQLFVMETTNSVLDSKIYNLTPESLFTWQRAMVANVLATNGEEWTSIFKEYNSGTYNNQYMIADMKRFSPGLGAQPGFLWIIEQMPGLTISKDVTEVMVQQGNYWPSYNVPYFPEIYVYSGFAEMRKQRGEVIDYNLCPRSRILRREHSAVQTFEQYKKILRHNKFQTDPLSMKNPTWVIAARCDLYDDSSKQKAYFAYDAKATSYSRIMFEDGLSDIINGPSYDDQPVFKWSSFNSTQSHVGHPDEFNFEWITIRPIQ